MSLLDGLLGQIGGQLGENPAIQNLAAKVGMSPEQVSAAVAALAQAHNEPTDTVATAADQTGYRRTSCTKSWVIWAVRARSASLSGMLGQQQGGIGGMLSGMFGQK